MLLLIFKDLPKKYSKTKERKTVISEEGFEQIEEKLLSIMPNYT